MKQIISVFIISVVVSVILAALPGPYARADTGDVTELRQLPELQNPKLDTELNRLARAQGSTYFTMLDAENFSTPVIDSVRVIVETVPGQPVAEDTLSPFGVIESSYDSWLQMIVPVSRLSALSEIPGISFIRQPQEPQTAVVSQGTGVINTDDWQSANYTGAGVKIGILDIGFSGYTTLQGQGEVAPPAAAYWAPSIGGPGSSNHGTACAEIVYDIAPGAVYYLANFGTEVEFGNAVDWLIAQDVDIISCSVNWPVGGPGDGTGAICGAVDTARQAGITWFQAAGNFAQRHWYGNFTDGNGDTFLDTPNTISVNTGEKIRIALKWSDTWGASGNDYDLLLINSGQSVAAVSMNTQDGNDNPWEYLSYTALYTGNYYITVSARGNPLNKDFHLYSYNHDLSDITSGYSIIVPADSPDAVTVGAFYWNNPSQPESFSSHGPADDGRIKPDLSAPDGVSVNTVNLNPFYGTSAATPHAAGAAALVKQRFPSYTPAQIQGFLEGRAADAGDAGKDNIFGSGLLNLGTPEDPPLIKPFNEDSGQYFNTAPVFSTLGFEDDVDLDSGWYQIDSYSGNWSVLFSDIDDALWTSENWTIPGFDALSEGSHVIYFKASDDYGHITGGSGEWSWLFNKDTIPPGAVSDMAIASAGETSLMLSWTAGGDDSGNGTAALYDIRYLEGTVLKAGNWETAVQASGEPSPGSAGSSENFTLYGLMPESTYFIGIRVFDRALNQSEISNIADAGTSPDLPEEVLLTGIASDVPLMVYNNGAVSSNVTLTSGNLTLEIMAGNMLLGPDGLPPGGIDVTQTGNVTGPPENRRVFNVWNFIPDGITTSQPVTVTVAYNPSQIPTGIRPEDIGLTFWSGTGWQTGTSGADLLNHTVNMSIDRLSSIILSGSYTSTGLSYGWNTLAVPYKLHSSTDTWKEFVEEFNIDYTAAYKWNGSAFEWVGKEDGLEPLDAIYVKADTPVETVAFIPFESESGPYTKTLPAGWNFIGPGFFTPLSVPVPEALTSVYLGGNNELGYSQVISPGGLSQPAWTYIRDETTVPDLIMGRGYWVYMENPAVYTSLIYTP